MQDHYLLRQVVVADELGQPVRHLVDLARGGAADARQRLLARVELPFGVQSQTDVRALEQILIDLGLLKEAALAGLQVDHGVAAGVHNRVDVGHEVLHRRLVGEVTVVARAAGGNGADDLERGDDRRLAKRLVVLGVLLRQLHRGRRVLLPHHAQVRAVRVAVESDHATAREHQTAAAGQLAALCQRRAFLEVFGVAPLATQREGVLVGDGAHAIRRGARVRCRQHLHLGASRTRGGDGGARGQRGGEHRRHGQLARVLRIQRRDRSGVLGWLGGGDRLDLLFIARHVDHARGAQALNLGVDGGIGAVETHKHRRPKFDGNGRCFELLVALVGGDHNGLR